MRHPPRSTLSGFTLVELLMVILIITVLAAAVGPAMSAIMSSGGANQNISKLSEIFEQAREYAVAQNTYVWVTFNPIPATGNTPDKVIVAVVASTDGTDPGVINPTATNPYGQVPSASLALISKVVTLNQLLIRNAATFPVSSLPATPVADSSNNCETLPNGWNFAIQTPGTGSSSTYTQVVQFTPSGQARNGSSPVDFIDFDVQPERGNQPDPKNVAVLRVNGLTGETATFR
jgi:prepilin-type N-terminal cleavage/methylation domain-containing protein